MLVAYFDCIAGASGDMILGALLDAGLPETTLRERLSALHLPGFDLRVRRVTKHAFTATKVDVIVADDVPERHVADIVRIVEASDLDPAIQARATAIFRRLGEAEAAIHGASPDHVHLHELGGVDTIVDVVGALVGLDALGVTRVVASPVPLGRGFIHGAHGQIPLPAPATVALLRGVPIVGSPLMTETVTPTGAVLLASLAEAFGPIPAMHLTAVGYGAGGRDLPIPNVLRLLLGEMSPEDAKTRAGESEKVGSHPHKHPHATASAGGHTHADPHEHPHAHAHPHDHAHGHESASEDAHEHGHAHTPAHSHQRTDSHEHPHEHSHEHPHVHDPGTEEQPSCLDLESLAVLETNVDDLNPEFYEHVMDALFDAGALDVFFAPIQMKKNRPATLLRVLCRPDDVAAMTEILFAETSTLGVRESRVSRHALPRHSHTVETPFGSVRVKVAQLPGGEVKCAPEYEDCRRRARERGVPLRQVYQAAQRAGAALEAGPEDQPA